MTKALIYAGCVALALAIGGAAAGQTGRPDYRDAKAVEAWMVKAKIDQGGFTRFDKTWLMIGTTPQGVYLSRRLLDQNHNRGRKFTILVQRLELFEPIVEGSRTIRSISMDQEVDCLRRMTRRVVMTTYTGHNLVGAPVSKKVSEPFHPFDMPMKPYADDICQAIEG